ncbi:Aminodeoxychorismate synthase component I [Planctomycetales bacterium 10988]|nr:Aminodeoxychorismate synthase component I [Planctomycetales bacterium 10988]
MSRVLPRFSLVEPIDPVPEIADLLPRFAKLPYCCLLESAAISPQFGRYSFLMADPIRVLRLPLAENQALDQLALQMESLRTGHVFSHEGPTSLGEELPPFQGGAVIMLSYELARQLERLPSAREDAFAFPALVAAWYDVVLAWDHQTNQAWLISQGLPADDVQEREWRARERLTFFKQLLTSSSFNHTPNWPPGHTRLSPRQWAKTFEMKQFPGLLSDFDAEGYQAAVARAIEYIYAGDIFQVNLSQRLLYPAHSSPVELYLKMRERNPAPFASYFDWGDTQLISASPERFLQVKQGQVETRPIKGTRARSGRPEADLFRSDELRLSDKDRSENVMIVDLLRNDLSRVCQPETFQVPQLCQVESYEYVQHLVSAIIAQLRPGMSPVDLLKATFPGGSITGAPKIRAMEIIAELEPTARGPYCGTLAYWGFDDAFDSNILIRTVLAAGGWWQASVGGGIVADSNPKAEYEETWQKAEGLLRAFS